VEINTQLKVKVRLTLIQKGTANGEVRCVTNGSRYIPGDGWDSWFHVAVAGSWVEYSEPINLTKEGDFWEHQINSDISSGRTFELERGETVNARLFMTIELYEHGLNGTYTWVHIDEEDLNELIKVTIFRPLLSIPEILVACGMGLLIGFGLLLFVLDRLGWVSFGFMDAFAEFSMRFPGLAEVGSFLILPNMWFLFVKALFLDSTVFAEDFSIFVYFGFLFLAVFLAIISIGLFEFIVERWGMMKPLVGFIAAMIFLYIVIVSIEEFLRSLAEYEM
jgi:hypothetical protein